jgi:predicted protein tyrosine phosphatase
MNAVHVTPLEELPQVLAASGAQRWVSFAAPGQSAETPVSFEGERLALEFHDISGPKDALIPSSRRQVEELVDFIRADHGPIILQCWMGVSRSTAAGLIAAVLRDSKRDCANAALNLRKAAPFATPNALIVEHADAILGLGGALREACAAIGRGETADRGRPFVLYGTGA